MRIELLHTDEVKAFCEQVRAGAGLLNSDSEILEVAAQTLGVSQSQLLHAILEFEDAVRAVETLREYHSMEDCAHCCFCCGQELFEGWCTDCDGDPLVDGLPKWEDWNDS